MSGNLTKLLVFPSEAVYFGVSALLCPKRMPHQPLVNLAQFVSTNRRVLLGLVYSAWKGSMNEFALVTQVQRVTGHNSSHQMNGFDNCGEHNLSFPASSLFQPRYTTQASFPSAESYPNLISWQSFRLSLKRCSSLADSKSFPLLINKSVSWSMNTGGESGGCLWPSGEGSGLDCALKQYQEETLPGLATAVVHFSWGTYVLGG